MDYESIIKRGPEAKSELVEAYTRIFSGKGTPKDAQQVFCDIMSFSGYFNVSPEGSNLPRAEGARSVGGRIFSLVKMSEFERDLLYQAARRDALINQQAGEL